MSLAVRRHGAVGSPRRDRGSRLLAAIALLTCLVFGSTGARGSDSAPCILVLGDSISAAYGLSLEEGWVALLEARLRERWPDASLINASISGDTSGGGLRRLPGLLAEHQPDLLIIELGGNDGLRGYPVSQLRDNLTRMAELAGAAGSRVLILPMEIPPNYGARYTAAFRRTFPDAAAAGGAELGPFPLADVATNPALMQADGIHPTAAAQPRIVARVLPAVTALLARHSPGDTP